MYPNSGSVESENRKTSCERAFLAMCNQSYVCLARVQECFYLFFDRWLITLVALQARVCARRELAKKCPTPFEKNNYVAPFGSSCVSRVCVCHR